MKVNAFDILQLKIYSTMQPYIFYHNEYSGNFILQLERKINETSEFGNFKALCFVQMLH